jgi:hypothetical protein
METWLNDRHDQRIIWIDQGGWNTADGPDSAYESKLSKGKPLETIFCVANVLKLADIDAVERIMAAPAPTIDENYETMKLSALLHANVDLLDLALPARKAFDGVAYPAILEIDVEDRSDTREFCHRTPL